MVIIAVTVLCAALAEITQTVQLPEHSFWLQVLVTLGGCFSLAVLFAAALGTRLHAGHSQMALVGGVLWVAGLCDLFSLFSYEFLPAFITANSSDKVVWFWFVARLWTSGALLLIFTPPAIAAKLRYPACLVSGAATLIITTAICQSHSLPVIYEPGGNVATWAIAAICAAGVVNLLTAFFIAHQPLAHKSSQQQWWLAAVMLAAANTIFIFIPAGSALIALVNLYVCLAYGLLATAACSAVLNQARASILTHCERESRAEAQAGLRLFARRLAHDVRNPLTAMRACAQLGEMRTTCSRSAELFQRIIKQIDYLSEMVGQTLPQMRLAIGKAELIDLNCLATEVVDSWRADAAARRLEIKVALWPDPLYVLAHPEQMRRALSNLIHNALQAMSPGGVVTVSLISAEEKAVVSVLDTGAGVAAADQVGLFKEFVATKDAGVGLGLAVTQDILADYGGRAWIDNTKLAPGAMFHFTLPLCVQQDECAEKLAAASFE